MFDPEPTSAETWREAPRAVLTPHTAGATQESLPKMIALALDNLNAFLAGAPLPTPIPELGS